MDNKKVTPKELNDEALEGATGGIFNMSCQWKCSMCKHAFEHYVNCHYVDGHFYCDKCYAKLIASKEEAESPV